MSNFICKTRYYFSYVSFSIPALLLVLISIDRFFSIARPDKFLFKNRIRFQLIICLIIIIFNICIYLPVFWFHLEKSEIFNNQTNRTEFTFSCEDIGFWFYLMDLFQSSLIPFTVMILTSIFTIKKVFDTRKLINDKNNNSNKNKLRDIKFAKISISTNIVFLAYGLPYFIYTLITDYTSLFNNLDADVIMIIHSISFLCFYIQFIDIFFINIFVNSLFKNEFKILFITSRNNN